MDFVIYFRRCKFSGIKGNGVEFFIKAFLKKDCPQSVIGGVNFDYNFPGGVK